MIGKTIFLKEVSIDDIPIINELRNDWDNKRMTLSIRFPISMENDMNWYEKISSDFSNNNVYFSIKLKDNSKTIGLVQLSHIDWLNKNAYIGIQIKKGEFGKGVGTETVNLITNYGFNILNLRKIIAEVASYNINSLKMFQKCNYIIEGILKQHIYYDNLYHDVFILANIKENSNDS